MDRERRIKQFVDAHVELLPTKNATKDVVKKLRQAFFEKHHVPAAERFATSELAAYVAKSIVISKKSKGEEGVVSACQRIPFVNELIGEAEIRLEFKLLNDKPEPILTSADFRAIADEEHLRKVERQFQKRATQEAERYLVEEKERLKTKEASLDAELSRAREATSVLDGPAPQVSIEEESSKSVASVVASQNKWWEDLGLEADPFPTDRGLVGIPEDKYDQIVVETGFIRKYLEVSRDPSYFLGKTIILAGEFGTGKTTLFSVCQRRMGVTGALPIAIIMNPSGNVGSLMVDFVSHLGDELCDATVQAGGPDLRRELGAVDSLPELGRVVQEALTRGIGSRTVIFVDGLHKGTKYTKETFEFLQQLQNTQEFLESRGVEVGILVAGSADWAQEYARTPSLSGSIHHIDSIPDISEDDAVEAAIRRILAFTRPGAPQPPLRREPLRLAFRALKSRTNSVTFRSFLNHIHNRLRAREFEELGLTIEPHLETIDATRKAILESRLRDAFLSLEKEIDGKPKTRQVVPKLLADIYAAQGIRESSGRFNQHRAVLHLLASTGLIEKGLVEHEVVWRVSTRLRDFLQQLYKNQQILPLDGLGALFVEKGEAVRAEVRLIYEDAIVSFDETAIANDPTWPEMADRCRSIAKRLRDVEKGIERNGATGVNASTIRQTTRDAMEAVAWGASGNHEPVDSAVFGRLWIAPENVEDFERTGEVTIIPTGQAESFGLFHSHADLMAQAGSLAGELTRGEGIARLHKRDLTAEDRQSIHVARLAFLKNDLRKAIDISFSYLEAKIRRTVFPRMSAVLGEQAEKSLPPDVLQNLEKITERGHPRAKRGRDANFLYDVSRSEYSKILFSKRLKTVLGLQNISSIDTERLKDSLELTFSVGDRESHGDRAQFFREHATEIGDCVKALPRLCEALNRLVADVFDDGFFEIKKDSLAVTFSAKLVGAQVASVPISVAGGTTERIVRSVLERLEERHESLDQLLQFVAVPGSELRQLLAVFATMHHQGLLEVNRSQAAASISAKGRERLVQLRKSGQTRLDQQVAGLAK